MTVKKTKPVAAKKPAPKPKSAPKKVAPTKVVKKPAARKRKPRITAEYNNAVEVACQEFVLNGGDQSKAYRKAFPVSARWKDKTVWNRASELFALREVVGRVKEMQEEAAKIAKAKFNVDVEYVLSVIVDTIERCRQTVTPKIARDGVHEITDTPTGEGLAYMFDAANVLKGTDQLGRHLKMFTDKIDLGGQKDNPILAKTLTADMPDEEAAQLYKELCLADDA